MVRALRLVALVAFASLLSALPACSGKGGSGKVKVAVVTNCTDPFWTICEAGAKQSAKDHDVELVFRQPATDTVVDQMEIVEALLKTGIKGLAISVINPKEQTPDLTRIAGQVNLLTMDNDAEKSGRLCYIGIDNYEAGKEAGRMVKRALPDGGTVAIFIGNTTSDNAHGRIAGVLDELDGKDNRAEITAGKYREKYGKFTLHRKEPITDGTTPDRVANNASDALEQLKNTPNVAMVGLYNSNPKGILEAARSKSLVGKIKIIGFDENPVTLEGIDKGEIEGTVIQDPYNYGYEAVKWLAHMAKGGDKKDLPTKAVPHGLVNKEGTKPPDSARYRFPTDPKLPDETRFMVYKASDYAKLLAGK